MPMKPRAQQLKLRLDDMREIQPMTPNQEKVFKAYEKGDTVILAGSAGTGKTFVAMSLALEDVLDKNNHFDKVIVVRSIVPTRDIGFLPGDEEEKKLVYEAPYRGIVADLFQTKDGWDKLKEDGKIEFMTTSFIRGVTLDNCVIVVDEMQNLTAHELDSVVTRIGNNCRLLMCGDYYQSDFNKTSDKDGILKFLSIMEDLRKVQIIEFSWEDIVRSDFVRDYIMTKEHKGIQF
jgi:phosphate starvation-inducible protein PhoH